LFLFYRALKEICKDKTGSPSEKDYLNPGDHNQENCQGVKVAPPHYFFPIPWFEAGTLFEPRKSNEDWETLFKDSYTVHFYQSSWKNEEEILWPEFYPEKLYPAYLPLALKHCPLSLYSDDEF
jgi:hypothetical protein